MTARSSRKKVNGISRPGGAASREAEKGKYCIFCPQNAASSALPARRLMLHTFCWERRRPAGQVFSQTKM